jgi:hypothetical protein
MWETPNVLQSTPYNKLHDLLKNLHSVSGQWWLRPVILAIQEAEIRKIVVQSQPRANSPRTPTSKILNTKKRTVRVA